MSAGRSEKSVPPQAGQHLGTTAPQSKHNFQSQGRAEAYCGARRDFLFFGGLIWLFLFMPTLLDWA